MLIAVVEREQPMVLLTQRTAHLPDHAGQIAFPGGKIDAGDATPLAAALREAQEEIGLAARFIEPIGYLDLYLTTLGYPHRADGRAGAAGLFARRSTAREVEDVFEVPLAFLMQAENHQRHSREWKGMMRTYYAIPFGERYIWGVTAGILRNLYERIYRRMIRPILTEILLFVTPFAIYALFLCATQRRRAAARVMAAARCHSAYRLRSRSGARRLLLLWRIPSAQPAGSNYVPPHMEDGKLVPGQFK